MIKARVNGNMGFVLDSQTFEKSLYVKIDLTIPVAAHVSALNATPPPSIKSDVIDLLGVQEFRDKMADAIVEALALKATDMV